MSNAAASVRARLLNVAKAQGVDFNQLLVRFALERILYRLKQKARAVNSRFRAMTDRFLFEARFCSLAAGWEKARSRKTCSMPGRCILLAHWRSGIYLEVNEVSKTR